MFLEACSQRLLQAKEGVQVPTRQVFKFVHESLSVLQPHAPEITLRLYLQAAQAADKCGNETITYEFVTQVCVLFRPRFEGFFHSFMGFRPSVSTKRSLVQIARPR